MLIANDNVNIILLYTVVEYSLSSLTAALDLGAG